MGPEDFEMLIPKKNLDRALALFDVDQSNRITYFEVWFFSKYGILSF